MISKKLVSRFLAKSLLIPAGISCSGFSYVNAMEDAKISDEVSKMIKIAVHKTILNTLKIPESISATQIQNNLIGTRNQFIFLKDGIGFRFNTSQVIDFLENMSNYKYIEGKYKKLCPTSNKSIKNVIDETISALKASNSFDKFKEISNQVFKKFIRSLDRELKSIKLSEKFCDILCNNLCTQIE